MSTTKSTWNKLWEQVFFIGIDDLGKRDDLKVMFYSNYYKKTHTMVGTKLQYKIIIYYEDFKCVKRPWAKFYTVIL